MKSVVSDACGNSYLPSLFTVPCASKRCENGGTCQLVAANTYGCACPSLYTGAQCETSILSMSFSFDVETALNIPTGSVNHPCVTMPTAMCQNGGTCSVNGANYACKCASGWSGPNCSTQDSRSSVFADRGMNTLFLVTVVNVCTPNLCGAYGTCLQAVLPTGPVAFCSCSGRWTGKLCDVNMDGECPAVCEVIWRNGYRIFCS